MKLNTQGVKKAVTDALSSGVFVVPDDEKINGSESIYVFNGAFFYHITKYTFRKYFSFLSKYTDGELKTEEMYKIRKIGRDIEIDTDVHYIRDVFVRAKKSLEGVEDYHPGEILPMTYTENNAIRQFLANQESIVCVNSMFLSMLENPSANNLYITGTTMPVKIKDAVFDEYLYIMPIMCRSGRARICIKSFHDIYLQYKDLEASYSSK